MATAAAQLTTVQNFSTPKSDPDAQNEDRCVPMRTAAVVIDGASTSIDAIGWVDALAAASRSALGAVSHGERIAEIERAARSSYKPPPRTADPKFAGIETSQQASATISVAALEQIEGSPCWTFEAVGDVGILLMRADGETVFRREDLGVNDFDSSPAMVRSSGELGGSNGIAFRPLPAQWNDRIIMFSDGLGEWITQCATLECLSVIEDMTASEFTELVQHERAKRRMPDDDATLYLGRLERAEDV